MKNSKQYISFSILFLVLFISFVSCRKEFKFEEIESIKNAENIQDKIEIDGSIAIPIVNTEFTISNYLPEMDSSFYVEIDNTDLAHFRMYIPLGEFTTNQIFSHIIYPAPMGYVVPGFTKQINTNLGKIKLYSNSISGHLFFDDPKITLKVKNTIPLTTYFRIDSLNFLDDNDLPISKTPGTLYEIAVPVNTGDTAKTDIVLNKTVIPELPELFSPIPKNLSMVLTLGNLENQALPFWIDGSEKMTVDADIDLPLDVRLYNLVRKDTVKFSFNEDTKNVTSATLKLIFNNGFPLESVVQVYFADSTIFGKAGNIVDSLFTDTSEPNVTANGWNLTSAQVDANGKVTGSTPSVLKMELTLEKLEKLKSKKQSFILIGVKFNSNKSQEPDKKFVKIYSDYKMGIKMGVKFNYSN